MICLWRTFRIHQAVRNILSLSVVKNFIMPFYAVAKGRTAGIYMTWPDCEAQVKGFPGAKYKKFDDVVAAQSFITTNGNVPAVSQTKSKTKNVSMPSSHSQMKRSFSTSSHNNKEEHVQVEKTKKSRKSTDLNNSEWPESDDDLNTQLTKQMDDIEKRLNSFQKGVDKIIQKGVKNKKTILLENNLNEEFQTDQDGFVQVYTDGACSSNGRQGARAGLGVYWGEGHPLNLSAPVSGRATNNCGEIQAATQAIKTALDQGITKLSINTDSKFLINSVTKWIAGWKRKGWKLQSGQPVKNEIDFKELDSLQNKLQIKWNYVEAHRGVHGNEMADQLAKAGAAMYQFK